MDQNLNALSFIVQKEAHIAPVIIKMWYQEVLMEPQHYKNNFVSGVPSILRWTRRVALYALCVESRSTTIFLQ